MERAPSLSKPIEHLTFKAQLWFQNSQTRRMRQDCFVFFQHNRCEYKPHVKQEKRCKGTKGACPTLDLDGDACAGRVKQTVNGKKTT